MIEEPKKKISPLALNVWRINASIWSAVFLSFNLVLIFLVRFFEWPIWIAIVSSVLWLLEAIFTILIFPVIRLKRWRYEVRDEEIELKRGLFTVEHTLVPMIRVQHVDTVQGPVLKKYNLAEISISTAATVHTIPALDMEEAAQLRTKISALARVAEDDV